MNPAWPFSRQTRAVLRLVKLTLILFLCLCAVPKVHSGATLFLEEPYGHDATFAGTGHAAVYLSGVCASSPVVLRLCGPGEAGVVLSRYLGIGGYDWIAIPRIPYLYAVERTEDIPLFANKRVVAFLRDQYRRKHLGSLIPDLPGGGTPDGNWYELIGASYLRTIYAFEIETNPEKDRELIRMLNDRINRQRWNLVTANCADFARQIVSFYQPHSVHRSIIGDLGVTTPKQLGRTLTNFSNRHPELQLSKFVIPQVPGTIPRSKRVKGVFEVMLTAKKYMWPIFLFHPYAAGVAVAVFVQYWHFNPGKNAPILDAKHELNAALTSKDRHVFQEQLEEIVRVAAVADISADDRQWTSLYAERVPALDDAGGPTLNVYVDGEITAVGIAPSNVLNEPAGAEFAAGIVEARLHEELKAAATRKTARVDVESDLTLLRQLLAPQSKGSTSAASFTALSSDAALTTYQAGHE
jgi:hypothetical protein